MGSWNATCGLSHLPIIRKDRVCIIILMDNHKPWNGNSGVYSTDFYTPFALPLRGTYDDYGRIEDLDDTPNVEHLRRWLQANVVELEEGENSHHDKPVTRADFDKDDWLEMVQQRIDRGRLRLSHHYTKGHLCSILVREDVYESLAAWEFQDFRDRVTNLETRKTKLLAHRQIKHEILEKRKDFLDKWAADKAAEGRLDARESMEEVVIDQAQSERLQFFDVPIMSPFREVFTERVRDADVPDEAMLLETAKLMHVKDQMSVLRRAWHPTVGSGSQVEEFEHHRQYAKMLAGIAKTAMDREDDEQEWLDKVRTELYEQMPPVRVLEYNERINMTKSLRDLTGAEIPGIGDFGDKTKFGVMCCLYVQENIQTGVWTYCLFDDGPRTWKLIEHPVAPAKEVLRYMKVIGPPEE